MERVARNEPCPCGSGKKFKTCCGTGDRTRSGVAGGRALGIGVGVVVIVGFLIAINHFRTADLSAGAATPEPWEYNAARNQHYNPLPGHEHWHEGPPPRDAGGALETTTPVPVQQPPAVPAAGSPEPWDYDATNDRHWNPVTETWDAGMPPLEALTSDTN